MDNYGTINNALFHWCHDKDFVQKAIIDATTGQDVTYNSLQSLIYSTSSQLIAMGVHVGDQVAIIASSSLDYIVMHLSIMNIGAVVVNINPNFKEKELSAIFETCNIQLVFTNTSNYSKIKSNYLDEKYRFKVFNMTSRNFKQAVQQINIDAHTMILNHNLLLSEDSPATIKFTSGTTGYSKAVVHTHGSILNCLQASAKTYGYKANDRILAALPLYHVMGCELTALLALSVGATLVLCGDFSTRKVLETIEEYHCTAFHGVPAMFKFLVDKSANYNISSLRIGMFGGSSLTAEERTTIINQLQLDDLITSYGQTEALAIVQDSVKRLHREAYDKSLGLPIKDVEIFIKDEENKDVPPGIEGEIVVQTPYSFDHYYNDLTSTKKTKKNGLLYTGDKGYLDKEGNLYFTGRIKDIIIRGGENISPLEIEEVIRGLFEVENVAVLPKPDKLLGEIVVAFVKLKVENSLTEVEIKDHCASVLARHKVPSEVYFLDELPLTASGKVKKYLLKDYIQ